MSSISLFLRTLNDSVNVFKVNQPYSEPKIFTGEVNITQWKDFTSAEKKLALFKEWFVYYSYRDLESGKLKRQSHIKAGANVYNVSLFFLLTLYIIKYYNKITWF